MSDHKTMFGNEDEKEEKSDENADSDIFRVLFETDDPSSTLSFEEDQLSVPMNESGEIAKSCRVKITHVLEIATKLAINRDTSKR